MSNLNMFGGIAPKPSQQYPGLNDSLGCGIDETEELNKKRRERLLQDDDEFFAILKMAVKVINF